KEVEGRPLVIEINDNPSIEQGVEDLVLKDTLYDAVIRSFVRRIEARTFRDVEALAPVAELRAKTVALYVEVVNAGRKSGEFRSDIDVDIVVRAMFDGLLGAARWFTGPRRRKPEQVAAALVDLYVHSLQP
ncbi:MAG: hypothetical protein ACK5CE_03125, partial [Actinomycetes bacterium]